MSRNAALGLAGAVSVASLAVIAHTAYEALTTIARMFAALMLLVSFASATDPSGPPTEAPRGDIDAVALAAHAPRGAALARAGRGAGFSTVGYVLIMRRSSLNR